MNTYFFILWLSLHPPVAVTAWADGGVDLILQNPDGTCSPVSVR